MTSLRTLTLQFTKATDTGVADLTKSLPNRVIPKWPSSRRTTVRTRDNRSHAASEGRYRGSDLAVTARALTAGPGVGRVAISRGCFHEALESGHDIAERRSTVTDRHGASELVVDVSLPHSIVSSPSLP